MKSLTQNLGFWLVGITLCIFVQVLSFDFVNLDDPSHLDKNPYFSPLTLKSYTEFWKKPYFLYMPVTYTFWSLGILASGPTSSLHFRFDPAIFHALTLFFHLISVLFIFEILKAFTKNLWACFLGALLFAVHPVQAEAVSWVSGLKDTLSGSLFFGSLFFFLIRKTALSFIFYLLALASKPSVVVLPPFIFLISLWHFRENWTRALKRTLPYLLLSLPVIAITLLVQPTDSLHFTAPSLRGKALVALDSLGFYVEKIFWPFSLTVDYGRTPKWVLSQPFVSFRVLGILLILISFAIWSFRKKDKRYSLGLGLFLTALLPVLGFKPFTFQTTSTVSDRFLYLPFVGLLLFLQPFIEKGVKTKAGLTILALLLMVLGARTVQQTGSWQNTVTVFEHAIEVNPRSWLSYNNLGSYYEREGNFERALFLYRSAASLDRQGIFYNNIGTVCLQIKDYACARAAFLEAIDINPLSFVDQNALGFAYLGLKDKKNARLAFERSLELNPHFWQSKSGLSLVGK